MNHPCCFVKNTLSFFWNFCFERTVITKNTTNKTTKTMKKENPNPQKTGQSGLLNCKTCNNFRRRLHVACRVVNFWKVIPEYKESNELDRTLLIIDEDNIENKKLTYYIPREMSLTDVLFCLLIVFPLSPPSPPKEIGK